MNAREKRELKNKQIKEEMSSFSLEEMKNHKNELLKDADALSDRAYRISDIIEERVIAQFKEGGHLNSYDWFIDVAYDGKSLFLRANKHDDYYLSKLIGSDDMYHFSHTLQKGVNFNSDDGDLSISFIKQEDIVPFINEWKLTVSSEILDKYEEKARIAFENAKALKEKINGPSNS
jgi:hypothetical protein